MTNEFNIGLDKASLIDGLKFRSVEDALCFFASRYMSGRMNFNGERRDGLFGYSDGNPEKQIGYIKKKDSPHTVNPFKVYLFFKGT